MPLHSHLVLPACFILGLAACGEENPQGAASPNQTGTDQTDIDMIDPDELPEDRAPDDVALFAAWLEEGAYKRWDCQAEPHPAVAPSPHGDNRICQNQIVTDASNETADFPVGATLVKEVYRDGKLDLLAVETRIESGDPAQSWLYFEARGDEVLFAGLGIAVCADCHANAERDYVWSLVK